MASMDDLVATVSGTHVSQDHYDLQNFRNYLAQTMVLPQVSQSGFLPPSRSTSTTRKSQPVTTPSYGYETNQPYPSPSVPQNSYSDYSHARPGSLQRQTSYGFGRSVDQSHIQTPGVWNNDHEMGMGMNEGDAFAGPSSPSVASGSYDAFASDAFAPLNRQAESDPWARMRQPQSAFAAQKQNEATPASNPWASFGRSTNGFGASNVNTAQQRYGVGRMPTPPDEDDEMMSDDEEDDIPEERFGSAQNAEMAAEKRALSMSGLNEQERVAALWQRGRRKT